jgi:superfamily II DNA or RNA helicase
MSDLHGGPVFDRGTLLWRGPARPDLERLFPEDFWIWDERVGGWRCDAFRWREVRAALRRADNNQDLVNIVEGLPVSWTAVDLPALRRDQEEALEAWRAARGRGLIVLPTGAGKTVVALAAMARGPRPTLVVAPIRDLMHQWHQRIRAGLGYDAGMVGDNVHDLRPVTVTTYHSAAIHMSVIGARFDLVVFDEVHHLPSAFFKDAARMCAAPFRLGLTATPERCDGRDAELDQLVGPIVYRQEIQAARGKTLADYEVVRVPVALSGEERARYDECIRVVREYVAGRRRDCPLYRWEDVLKESVKDPAARKALRAFLTRQKIENEAVEKLEILEDLFRLHAGERVLVFAGSNPMAVKISRRFLVPTILASSRKAERREVLDGFAAGRFPVLVSNRVLDEGLDVPEVKVAIVVGGLASVRQAKQRLGRILRPSGKARAVLYEVVAETSPEKERSRKRRQSDAFSRTRHHRL